jgi:hypothetical protein
MNTGNDASVSFLRKNHSFSHPSGGTDIGIWKWGSTPCLDLMKMSTLPKSRRVTPCLSNLHDYIYHVFKRPEEFVRIQNLSLNSKFSCSVYCKLSLQFFRIS